MSRPEVMTFSSVALLKIFLILFFLPLWGTDIVCFVIVALSQYHLRSQSFYIPDTVAVSRFPPFSGRCWLLLLFAAKAFLSPLLITKMSIITWFATGEDLFKWCTLRNVALIHSVSFPVFRRSIDSLSIVPFFMLNDALPFTSFSTSSGFLLLVLLNLSVN